MDHVEPSQQPNFMELARSIIALNQQNQLNQFYRNSLLQASLLGNQPQSGVSGLSSPLDSLASAHLLTKNSNDSAGSAGSASAGHSSPGEEESDSVDVKMEDEEGVKTENNDEIETISTHSKTESIKDENPSISAAASIFKLHGM